MNPEPQAAKGFLARPDLVSAYLLLSLAGFLSVLFLIWTGRLLPGDLTPERAGLLKAILYAFCFGGLGGTAYSIYGLYKHTSLNDYSPAYFYWYLFRTPLGAVLGMISYFLIQGGLFAFAQAPAGNTFQAKALYVSVAFLAGFSVNQFVAKLKSLSQSLFGVKSHKET